MLTKKIIEYIKLLGMTVVFTAGQAISFWIIAPIVAEMFGQLDSEELWGD